MREAVWLLLKPTPTPPAIHNSIDIMNSYLRKHSIEVLKERLDNSNDHRNMNLHMKDALALLVFLSAGWRSNEVTRKWVPKKTATKSAELETAK